MCLVRTNNLEKFQKFMEPFEQELYGFHSKEWLENENNIALINDNGDYALFEFEIPGVYSGHYFFNSRGKDAVKAARELLKESFEQYPIKVIRGLTPIENLGARWLSRKLGFASYGAVNTLAGYCELFILTKEEFNEQNIRRE